MIFKFGVLKYFAMFIGKTLCWSIFSIQLKAFKLATLLKRDSNPGVFQEYCEIFKNSFFYRIPLVATSGIKVL